MSMSMCRVRAHVHVWLHGGRPMKEWLRFAVCYWHTWRGNGADIFGLGGAIKRPWDGDDMEAARTRVDVHFEFCQKLGIE